MEQPVYYWDPVIAPSGMAFYHAAAIPEWQGSLFIGALAGQHINRLVLEGGRVMYERLLSRSVAALPRHNVPPDGSLYAITDGGSLHIAWGRSGNTQIVRAPCRPAGRSRIDIPYISSS